MRIEDKKEIYRILSDNTITTFDEEYNEFVADIINNPVVTSMKEYIQHGTTTCYDHCVSVSYASYKIAKYFNMDAKSTARAALLHDLFLYDWHTAPKTNKLFQKHGFTHSKEAFNNANKYFKLNDIEKDIILKHMWPLNISLPKYKETCVIILIDKICSIFEFMNYHFPLNLNDIKKKYKKKK